ncbi:hypothetical protein HYC85_022358 [Camellia sinensis]|uniref:Exoribonuclease phosphorolytic domain-containing protein n=1 Tax=Camellia sinensis TaxID=4442 RepID=A0A7J7GMU8_CAMSI|nr:hypothetical protein HYC85_022358 [Camellia sinensis]
MSSANASSDLSSEMEVDDFRHLFPLCFHECHLLESIRPDARKLGKARDTTLALVIDFHMPPICSPIVRPDSLADATPVKWKQLCDTILRHVIVIISMLFFGDIYCLDADGSLFDTALLATVAAFSHCKIYTPFTFLSFFMCMP